MSQPDITFSEKIQILENDALIVVDIQNDFIPGGALAVPDGDNIIPGVNKLMIAFKNKGNLIILTQDWHPAGHLSFASSHDDKQPFDPISDIKGIGPVLWPDHCIQGSKGAEFHQDLKTN